MLFQVINCNPDELDNDKLEAISNILRSHREQKNIVFADKNCMESIVTSNSFGQLEKLTAADIIENRREIGQLRKYLKAYIVIDFVNNTSSHRTDGDTNIITLGYQFFSDSDNVGAISLVTENPSDFEYYNTIGKYYAKHQSQHNLGVVFRNQPGHGSHSKETFDRLTNENNIVLCLVDNDKKHPRKGEGSTSGVFTNIDKNYNNHSLTKVIEVREVESLIPTRVIETVASNIGPDKVDALDEMKRLSAIDESFRVYFDHKHGLTLNQAIELDNIHGSYWLDILSSTDRFSSMDCFQQTECTTCGNCPKVEGFGDNILRNSLELMKISNINTIVKELDDYIKPHWLELGELLLSWGCAGKRQVRS